MRKKCRERLSAIPKGKVSKTRALAGCFKSALLVDGREVTPVEREVALVETGGLPL